MSELPHHRNNISSHASRVLTWQDSRARSDIRVHKWRPLGLPRIGTTASMALCWSTTRTQWYWYNIHFGPKKTPDDSECQIYFASATNMTAGATLPHSRRYTTLVQGPILMTPQIPASKLCGASPTVIFGRAYRILKKHLIPPRFTYSIRTP